MNEHPAPPPPPRRIAVLQTTIDILKETTSIFSTTNNLITLLLLSLFLLSIRASFETAADFITSFIDNDPSIKSIYNRIHSPPNSTSPTTTTRPFLQLTRVETLDDEFDDQFVGSSLSRPQLNDTSVILDSFDPQLGFSNFGIRASETVRSGSNTTFRLIDRGNDSARFNDSIVKPGFWTFWFDLSYHELTAILFLIGAVSVTYLFLFLGIVMSAYGKVHGIVYVLVVNDFCERHKPVFVTFSIGSWLGERRLSFFFTMKWAVRELLTQVFGFWFFLSATGPTSNLKINLMSKFMPFSFMCFWDKVLEKEVHGFLSSWVLLDLLMSYVFAFTPWILMADPRKGCRQVVKEGFHLLSLMFLDSISLKVFEAIVCGPYARLVVARTFGGLFAIAFQSFMEVYFMVVWVVYYFYVKSIDTNSSGQPFGQQDVR